MGMRFFNSSIYRQDGVYHMGYRGRDAGIGDELPSGEARVVIEDWR